MKGKQQVNKTTETNVNSEDEKIKGKTDGIWTFINTIKLQPLYYNSNFVVASSYISLYSMF